jgi:type II secretory pathway pseudopilin PulG
MTLIELTVIIVVLLSLFSILFVGASSWKRGSDRAGCILNLRNIQQAVRGHQNAIGKNQGDPLAATDIIGASGYITIPPVCPSNGNYTLSPTFPPTGTLALTCDRSVTLDHNPNDTTGW